MGFGSALGCVGAISRTIRGCASAHPLLQATVAHVAHYQIRNRGTVGGSLAHADPAAELPGIAVACDARSRLSERRRARAIAAADFFLGPLSTALAADEIITEMQIAGVAGRDGAGPSRNLPAGAAISRSPVSLPITTRPRTSASSTPMSA